MCDSVIFPYLLCELTLLPVYSSQEQITESTQSRFYEDEEVSMTDVSPACFINNGNTV